MPPLEALSSDGACKFLRLAGQADCVALLACSCKRLRESEGFTGPHAGSAIFLMTFYASSAACATLA